MHETTSYRLMCRFQCRNNQQLAHFFAPVVTVVFAPIFMTMLLLFAYPMTVLADDAMLDNSQVLVQRFETQLRTALKQTMAEGGPLAALTVCKDLAPQIAATLSRESGAKVSRTSDRFRNPANAPEPWQAEILTDFNNAMSDENPLPEYFEQQADGSGRFMKAIKIQPPCLVCHGVGLSGEVSTMLNDVYPHDRAINYSLNELRGAFSVTWPAPVSVTNEK